MEPIVLMRKLFGFQPDVSDEDMVILAYQEFTRLQAHVQIQQAVQAALHPEKEQINGEEVRS